MITNRYKILIINGPNINLIGQRELDVYGLVSIDKINKDLNDYAKIHCIELDIYQSNIEGELINKTQEVLNSNIDFLIINPAGYTHSSIAWRDTLLAINKPFIEVHLSNINNREKFRKKSFFADIAIGTITGLGKDSYKLALIYAIEHLSNKE